ncbi:exonuclease SbcCD subunit D [Kocuria sp. cx-455]|uniref:exonuclease SbcCD subunit D n=1 Tax=unclassified Candidatus Sulfotelmatobacter TaxID=2635724 RepID=UPI001686EB6D|nr:MULTISPECIES: exonuclease SbcCD subunit D [unclassified Candidatus Sulfotelmatobacter]MBD2761133.1 exonuclease SbcCD subunit D [Kocuria sp. cx-116]MBD2764722.1 exonuclease SbcCD subunit D [Kocuria sp. cx-455]
MRFLHTSDWHLGRTFHGVDVLNVQARAMDEIAAWVVEHRIDAVLISGDVYDRAQPRTEVVELLNATLASIRRAGAYVVMTSGNHDSAARLGFGAQIMAHGGVFIRTRAEQAALPILFSAHESGVRVTDTALNGDDPGERPGAPTVAVYGIPYLEPRSVAPRLACSATHQDVLDTIATSTAADLRSRAHTRGVVMAHAFVTGAATTDSERVIDCGGLGTVSADVFAAHSYAALGHIHRRQAVRPAVRYSGSPVAYSFSETGQTKGAWLVEFTDSDEPAVTSLDHRAGLHLAQLRGNLADLLRDPGHASAESAWCQVVLTDPERPASAMERIRTRFPQTVELRWEPEGGRSQQKLSYSARVEVAQSPDSLCASFFDHVRQRSVSDAEQNDIASAVAAARAVGASE